MKRKVNCGQLSLGITLLGLPHIVKATSETWSNPRVRPFQRALFSAERLTSCQTSISCSRVTARINWEICKIIYPFQDGGRYHIETSPLIWGANQGTGFYMITASVLKGFRYHLNLYQHLKCVKRTKMKSFLMQ